MNPGSYAIKILNNQYEQFREVTLKKEEVWWGRSGHPYRYTKTNWHWDFAHQRYYYCTQVWNVYDGTFKDFLLGLENGFWLNDGYARYSHKMKCRYRWWGRWDHRTGESRFVQRGYAKKELSVETINKRAWKQSYRRRKDSKPGGWYGYHGPGNYDKRIAARQHRAWQKQKIAHGRYDELGNSKSHKGCKLYDDWW